MTKETETLRPKLSDGAIKLLAAGLKRKHRAEWSQLVYDACQGRSMQQVADLLGYSPKWVRDHLRLFAIEEAVGGRPGDGVDFKRDDVHDVVQQFAPSKPSQEYLDDYERQGFSDEVCVCLATTVQAADKAIDKGALKLTHKKEMARIDRELFSDSFRWSGELMTIRGRVLAIYAVLNDAKISDLRSDATRIEMVKNHARWMEQIERIRNFHPTFDDEVRQYEG